MHFRSCRSPAGSESTSVSFNVYVKDSHFGSKAGGLHGEGKFWSTRHSSPAAAPRGLTRSANSARCVLPPQRKDGTESIEHGQVSPSPRQEYSKPCHMPCNVPRRHRGAEDRRRGMGIAPWREPTTPWQDSRKESRRRS